MTVALVADIYDKDVERVVGFKMKATFDQWMEAVNTVTWKTLGLDTSDLTDAPYHNWYDNGKSPNAAAAAAAKLSGF